MHVVHLPRLPRAAMVATIAAVLALAVTLIFATAVSDLQSSSSGSSTRSYGVPAVHHQTPALAWSRNPFAPLLRTTVVAPWTEHPLLRRADSGG